MNLAALRTNRTCIKRKSIRVCNNSSECDVTSCLAHVIMPSAKRSTFVIDHEERTQFCSFMTLSACMLGYCHALPTGLLATVVALIYTH